MFWKRGSGRVRLQGGGDDEGWKTKEETDVTESKKYYKSLSLERSRLELRSVLYLYKRNKNKVFSFPIKFLFIFTWHPNGPSIECSRSVATVLYAYRIVEIIEEW